MKLTSSQKLIFAIVAVVVIAALAVFLLVVPQIGAMGRLDSEIAQADSDLAAAQTLLDRRQESKSRSAETESRLLRLLNELPESPEMPGLIIELQDAVNESGLEFVSITPQEPEVREGYSAVLLEMQLTGRWEDYVDLLQRLRRLTRQVRIVGFDVSRYEAEDAADSTSTVEPENLVTGIINIEVYTLAEPQAASTGAVPAPTNP